MREIRHLRRQRPTHGGQEGGQHELTEVPRTILYLSDADGSEQEQEAVVSVKEGEPQSCEA